MLSSFVLLSIYTCKVLGGNDIETNISYSIEDDIKGLSVRLPGPKQEYNKKTFEALDSHLMKIHDVRGKEKSFSLFKNGFEYTEDSDLSKIINDIQALPLNDNDKAKKLLDTLKEPICEMMKNKYDAEAVILYDTRDKAMVPTEAAIASQKLAVGIHSDYSPKGAKNRYDHLHLDVSPDELADFKEAAGRSGKWAFVHVWTPLSEMKFNHVAVGDWKTFKEGDTFEVGFDKPEITEGCRHWKYNAGNKWYYKSNQKSGEFLLYTQYKNDERNGMTLPHSGIAGVTKPGHSGWNTGVEFRVAMALKR